MLVWAHRLRPGFVELPTVGFAAKECRITITCSAETRRRYDGAAGAWLAWGSLLSLHEPLIGRLFRRRAFDISRVGRILDVGSGAGQILKHILAHRRPECAVVAFDLSTRMLSRARARLRRPEIDFVGGDAARLPFADASFDYVTCGWMIEHLSDPCAGLKEMARVMKSDGRLLLLATENTWAGSALSQAWKCRTFGRAELRSLCSEAGLDLTAEFWLTSVHKFFRMGGILVEARKSTRDSR